MRLAVVILLATFAFVQSSVAADKPVPKRETSKKQPAQKQFERGLLAPIGKGRLE